MVKPINNGKKFYATFTSWWLIWACTQTWLLNGYGINPQAALTDSIVSNALLASACLLVINNMKYYLPRQERYWYILIISVVLSSLYLLLTRTLLSWLFKTDNTYIYLLSNSLTIRYITGLLMIGCMSMICLLWYTLQEQRENDQRKEAAEQMAKDAELLKLRQQLQPHFLFNSLNSISALAGSQPEKARHMIQQLSDFLRGTLKKEEHQHVSLEEEIHHLQLYLDIEKVRFGHRLQTTMTLQEGTGQLRIPVLLLQPVVENAIKFGLYDTTGEVLISIKASLLENNILCVEVQNPYDHETAGMTRGTGFGLASIRRRLYLLFARNDLLQTASDNSFFTTKLLIPQYHYESNHH